MEPGHVPYEPWQNNKSGKGGKSKKVYPFVFSISNRADAPVKKNKPTEDNRISPCDKG
jgi:hypothetical protein